MNTEKEYRLLPGPITCIQLSSTIIICALLQACIMRKLYARKRAPLSLRVSELTPRPGRQVVGLVKFEAVTNNTIKLYFFYCIIFVGRWAPTAAARWGWAGGVASNYASSGLFV